MFKGKAVKTAPDVATPPPSEFAARIGLDWADQKHFRTMLDSDGKTSRGQIDNTLCRFCEAGQSFLLTE